MEEAWCFALKPNSSDSVLEPRFASHARCATGPAGQFLLDRSLHNYKPYEIHDCQRRLKFMKLVPTAQEPINMVIFCNFALPEGQPLPQVLPHPEAVGAEQRRAPAAIAGLYIDAGAVQIA